MRIVPLSAGKRDPNPVGAVDDVVICDDITIGRYYYAGALAVHLLIYKDGADAMVVRSNAPHGVDIYDGRRDMLNCLDDRICADARTDRAPVEDLQSPSLRFRRIDDL